MSNRLKNENSRYLQQHAENPVDWFPWGEEALEKARRENKPIFLSIGYSACHWCHVMAHESFENKTTADLLNRHFISIKVDREERPDLDRIYMDAVQAMTGSGGWPMSVFLTPEGQPFYGGTYFPPEPRQELPSFNQLLMGIADAWKNDRADLVESGMQLVEMLDDEAMGQVISPNAALNKQTISQAVKALRKSFDALHGGWGAFPKFPQPMTLLFLLRRVAGGDISVLDMITPTLEAMAFSGLYDQIGGGFHRYSVDASWTVPHFEKMLYDNALLARVYTEAWQLTKDDLYRTIAEETLDYVLREMTAPEGYFYATQDADSEGEEGKFFVWTPDEVREVLGEQATHFLELYGITHTGNFEGKNVLSFQGTHEQRAVLGAERLALRTKREKRVHPGRDEKLVTAWNGLMLTAFALAARVFGRSDYAVAAQRCAEFLLSNVSDVDNRLSHVWNRGKASVTGMLDDYANLAEGLLMLYEKDVDVRWYQAAESLIGVVMEHFIADESMAGDVKAHDLVYAGFFDTADDAESLIIRPREMQDNAVPSGNAMAATLLLRLARLNGNPKYDKLARSSLVSMAEMLGSHPLAFAQWLVALDASLAVPVEVAIKGDAASPQTQALLGKAREGYHPHTLVAVGSGDVPALLAHRDQVDGKATAYVCKNHVCQPPVVDAVALATLLN